MLDAITHSFSKIVGNLGIFVDEMLVLISMNYVSIWEPGYILTCKIKVFAMFVYLRKFDTGPLFTKQTDIGFKLL